MISVIIPVRTGEFLQKTVDDLLTKAEGEVEVIAVLDGVWLDPMPKDDKRVVIVHHGMVHDNYGMRASINLGMSIAKGDYVMKCDEHTMVDYGYDVKLAADCEDNWVVVPRRKRLDPETWTLIEDGRPPVDYMSLDYPYQRPYDKTCGLHGGEDKQRQRDRINVPVDDLMTMQGSCYFMKKTYWEELFPNGLDDVNYGTFTQEAQEISNAAWLSGGRVMVNKKTWYAHYHKGKRGKGYGFSNEQYKKHMEGTERGRVYCIEYWLNTKDFKYDFEWLVNKFWPLNGWPENWKEQIQVDREKDYSRLKHKKDWFENNEKQD